jgi:hypothetical protein
MRTKDNVADNYPKWEKLTLKMFYVYRYYLKNDYSLGPIWSHASILEKGKLMEGKG